jgi:hypothetical protein
VLTEISSLHFNRFHLGADHAFSSFKCFSRFFSSDGNLEGFLLMSSINILLSNLALSDEHGLRSRSDSRSFS